MLKRMRDALLDLIFPPICVNCRTLIPESSRHLQLCPACQRALVFNRPPFCRRCSRPLTDPRHPLCAPCRHQTLHFDRAWGACLYNPALRRLLHLFKYGHRPALRHVFLQQIQTFIRVYKLSFSDCDYVVPVPLHPKRLRRRGYNQAGLLARGLAQALALPLCADNLIRARHTVNQARLRRKERWTNIKGAFKIKYPNRYIHKNILLIDDLLTTGATTSEAARALKAAGAGQVIVLTLAIAEKSGPRHAEPRHEEGLIRPALNIGRGP